MWVPLRSFHEKYIYCISINSRVIVHLGVLNLSEPNRTQRAADESHASAEAEEAAQEVWAVLWVAVAVYTEGLVL